MNIGIIKQDIIEKDNNKTDILLRLLIDNGTTMNLIKKSGKYNDDYVYYGVHYANIKTGVFDTDTNKLPTKMSREDYDSKLKQQIEGEGEKYNFIKIENKYDDKYNDGYNIYGAAVILSIIIIFIIVIIFLSDMNNTSIFLYLLYIIPVWFIAFSLNKFILPFLFKKYDQGIAYMSTEEGRVV